MFFEEDDKQYRLVAPDVDELLRFFDHGLLNPTRSTSQLSGAAESLFDILKPLAPLKDNDEVKSIWVRVPRGTIDDYTSFEEMKEWEEVETYEEYTDRWLYDYPEDYIWYELVVVKSFDRNGSLRYYGVSLGNKRVISATTDERVFYNSEGFYAEEAAVKLCSLISPAVQNSIDLLKAGRYNALVEAALPYQFRTGVVKRSALWEAMPDVKKHDYDGLSENTVQEFKNLIRSGINHEDRIGRMKDFTANDFFRACKIGYEAIGKDCDGYSLSELYIRYSDGRDEGLTGSGLGLNAGPGIDFDSPSAWDSWYYDRDRGGGHPWEVVPGGNSTHVELFVKNDKRHLEWDLRSGKITKEEYQEKLQHAGYYFAIAGMQRQFEAVTFYVALSSAGYPVIIEGAEALLARFEATDYVGIVPHHLPTRYCESMFPDSYGTIVDFTHVYKDEDATWFDKIEWLPEEEAELVNNI